MTQQQPALPPARTLSARQQMGIDCARCGAYLGARWRHLGVAFHRGHFFYLFGCAPHCPPPRRVPRGHPADHPPGACPDRHPPISLPPGTPHSPRRRGGRDRPPRASWPRPGAATTQPSHPQAAAGQALHPSPTGRTSHR